MAAAAAVDGEVVAAAAAVAVVGALDNRGTGAARVVVSNHIFCPLTISVSSKGTNDSSGSKCRRLIWKAPV